MCSLERFHSEIDPDLNVSLLYYYYYSTNDRNHTTCLLDSDRISTGVLLYAQMPVNSDPA